MTFFGFGFVFFLAGVNGKCQNYYKFFFPSRFSILLDKRRGRTQQPLCFFRSHSKLLFRLSFSFTLSAFPRRAMSAADLALIALEEVALEGRAGRNEKKALERSPHRNGG